MTVGKKIKIVFCFSIILATFILLSPLGHVSRYAYAANSYAGFDSSYVIDDLQGGGFDLTKYPYKANGTTELLYFAEYAYSPYDNLREYYGLYFYIYNPKALDFSLTSVNNKVQIADKYDKDGNVVSYKKYSLTCVSVSTGDYARLYYKYKVIFSVDELNTLFIRLNSNGRRYDVSGIELIENGKSNAVEYSIATAFTFSGYAKGLGLDPEAESTLKSSFECSETIELQVKKALYRTGVSSSGKNHQWQIDSVYFSVPDRYFDNYGKLQRIQAEWYEYKTNDIVVTCSEDFYNATRGYVGSILSGYNSNIKLSLYQDPLSIEDTLYWSWAYNPRRIWPADQADRTVFALYYLFYYSASRIEPGQPGYDPAVQRGTVSGNQLYDYILGYKRSFVNGRLPIKHNNISADLFRNTVDAGRKRGLNKKTFDADILLDDMLSYNSSHNWWQKYWDYGFFGGKKPDLNDTYTNVSPIETIDKDNYNKYFSGSATEISRRLLITSGLLLNDFQSFCNDVVNKNEKVVILRFATTDYYSSSVTLSFNQAFKANENDQVYRAQQTVFLDFDIISLTFYKDGIYTVIPAVSDPFDIVNDVTPPLYIPPETPDWVASLLRILGIVLLVVVVLVFLSFAGPFINLVLPIVKSVVKFIVSATVKLVTLPFKLLGKLFGKKKSGRLG